MMYEHTVTDIRDTFVLLLANDCTIGINREASMKALVGSQTIEIVGASFIANKPVIFGEVNPSYMAREEQWYRSMSRNVNDIPGGAPDVWKAIAAKDGTIVSNYGWMVWSPENGAQFEKVVKELNMNPASRRAVIIYTRPSMWEEYNWEGRSDFCCTNVVQYMIRNGEVHAIVQMRSNDCIYGFKNDYAWQECVLKELANELACPVGQIYWQVGSLHVYSRHFYLVDHFARTGEESITKTHYRELYPESRFLTFK
jgi:thymidylate synthase